MNDDAARHDTAPLNSSSSASGPTPLEHGGPTSPPPAYPPPTTTPLGPVPARRRARGRLAFASAVVAASLVVGGAAGVGGAAAWSSIDGDASDGASSTDSGQSSLRVADTSDAPAAAGSVEDVAQTVLPSVVKLDVSGAGAQGEGAGSGSGIILDESGLILTNEHVVTLAGAVDPDDSSVTVSFDDGSRADATVVGVDPLTDTALVQAQDVDGLTPATIGSSEKVDVGEDVVAIGSPFGLDATVTSGIVSALDRAVDVGTDAEGNSTTYPAIQTDAAINPGNSGGPLVDDQGHVIGINSSIRSGSSSGEGGSIGLGFAIPIDEVLPIIEQLEDGETPTHARLGVQVSDAVAEGTGAQVTEGAQVEQVTAGSAAGSAGLEDGDVVTAIDGSPVTGADSLVATIRSYRPGDQVEVTFERDGEEQTATLELESDAGSAG